MNKNDVFEKIINNKNNSKIVYRDNLVTAFYDINPKAPLHILIVTNKKISTVNDIKKSDRIILGNLFYAASKIAKIKNIDKSGYKLIVNCNEDGGQKIYHLHMHMLGGIKLNNFIV